MLKKVNKATPTAATLTKPQGQVEKTVTTSLGQVVGEGPKQGTVRVVVNARLSANYNSVGVEVGGEIPFAIDRDGDPLEQFEAAFKDFYEKVETIVDDKLEEMRKVLTEVGKK